MSGTGQAHREGPGRHERAPYQPVRTSANNYPLKTRRKLSNSSQMLTGSVNAVCYGPTSVEGQAPLRRRRLIGFATVALFVLALPAVGGAGSGTGLPAQADALRARNAGLASSSHTALLSLYSLDSRLAHARTQLAAVQRRAAAIRRDRADVAHRLDVARRAVKISERRLAERLRLLYDQGDVSPLEVVLGAKTMDEAIAGIDNLGTVARQDRSVLEEVKGAHASLAVETARLRVQQAEADRLAAAAAETTASLAATRSERAAYLQSLAGQRRLNAQSIASLVSRAQAAQVRTATLEQPPLDVAASATAAAPSANAAASAPVAGGSSITVSATGYALGGTTATGIPVGYGVVAVDPSVIPLGTRMTIPGYGEAVAADTGGAVRGATIDLWFPSAAQARAWGRRTVTITLH